MTAKLFQSCCIVCLGHCPSVVMLTGAYSCPWLGWCSLHLPAARRAAKSAFQWHGLPTSLHQSNHAYHCPPHVTYNFDAAVVQSALRLP